MEAGRKFSRRFSSSARFGLRWLRTQHPSWQYGTLRDRLTESVQCYHTRTLPESFLLRTGTYFVARSPGSTFVQVHISTISLFLRFISCNARYYHTTPGMMIAVIPFELMSFSSHHHGPLGVANSFHKGSKLHHATLLLAIIPFSFYQEGHT